MPDMKVGDQQVAWPAGLAAACRGLALLRTPLPRPPGADEAPRAGRVIRLPCGTGGGRPGPRSQPAGLRAAVLHFIAEAGGPRELVAALRDVLAPGSYVAPPPGQGAAADRPRTGTAFGKVRNGSSATAIRMRSRADIARFRGDFDLADPGLACVSQSRPGSPAASPQIPAPAPALPGQRARPDGH